MSTTAAPPTPQFAPRGSGSRPQVGRTNGRMWTSRLIGALFLAGFLVYGTGSILVTSVVDRHDFLTGLGARETTLALGAFLMIATAAIDIGKAVLFFPVLQRNGSRTAVAYLATMVFEMALMTVGVLALLLLIPLAEQADQFGAQTAQALGSLAVDANETAYQIGQLSLAFGCLFLSALLYRTGLVPRWLAAWGFVGYAVHLAGAGAELFGAPISLVLLIPGGVFEVTLAIWLLVKGLDAVAFDLRRSDHLADREAR